jgi:pimeloyl-ACP methyl ester carboxylesterase
MRGSIAGVLVACACSSHPETSAIDRLQPCAAADGPTDGYCGVVEVWEDRGTRTGRRIGLKVVMLPALKQDHAGDPLVILAGGPGQGAADMAAAYEEILRPVEIRRDIVFVDQRGTGKSNPLECRNERDAATTEPGRFATRMRACLEAYRPRADVTRYTTDVAMDDLDDVRRFLGYSAIDLYGVSYGTRAAMVYVRRHGDHVRTVVLDGVTPPDSRLPLYFARDAQRALDLLFRDCAGDPACNARFPDLRRRLPALLDDVGAHPRRIRFADPQTGLSREVEVTREMLGGILFTALYSPTTAADVPLLIEQAEQGNFAGFLAMGASFRRAAESVAKGMEYSVVCSEDAPRIAPGAIEREAAGTFLGPALARSFLEPCAFWPAARMDPAYYEVPPSSLPALVVSGALDPVTPPAWGADVASHWKNARHVVLPGAGHFHVAPGESSTACVVRMMAAFLEAGTASGVDASCAERSKRPPFFLSPSGPVASAQAAR